MLAVSGLGASVGEARDRAYEALDRISFPGKTYRTDIAAAAAEDIAPDTMFARRLWRHFIARSA